MYDIRQFVTTVQLSKEADRDYKDNVEFDYVEVNDAWMYVVAFLPLVAGLIDMNILNAIGCYQITWFQLIVIFSAVICALDCARLYKMSYSVDNLIFFAFCITPVYLYMRGRIVGHGKLTSIIWCSVMLVVSILAPL